MFSNLLQFFREFADGLPVDLTIPGGASLPVSEADNIPSAWALCRTIPSVVLPGCGNSSDTQEGQATAYNGGKQSAAANAAPQRDGIIGRWVDNLSNPLFSSTLTILVEDGRYYLETKYDDGSSRRTALAEKESELGRRFDIAPETNAFQMKDYRVIDGNGDLLLQNELNPGVGPKARRIE